MTNYAVSEDLPPPVINDPSLPLVSIVTPSFNQGGFVRQTIESVLKQDYPNIEYWVIDGGSTDETLAILEQYGYDPRFHWISEKDKGQSDAINKGLARCRGEIFNWLCSDDLLLPGALRCVVNAWTSLPQPSVIYGWARLIDRQGNDLGYCPLQSSQVTLRKMLRFESFPMQQATFVPTDYLRSIGGIDGSLHYAMDVDLWIRLIERLPFHHISNDLGLYRLHASSKTVSLSVRFIDDVTKILVGAAQRKLVSDKLASAYADLFAARVYLTPDAWNLRLALNKAWRAVTTAPAATPLALFVLLKGAARTILGENHWSRVRLLQVKFR